MGYSTPTGTGGGGSGGGSSKITFDSEFPIAPNVSDLQVRWNAPEAGTIQAIYVWADDAVPTSAGAYTISAASGGSTIFANFNLKGVTLATQTSVGTLTNATLASGAEVEFTIASNNADLAGGGMRLQIVFLAATSTATPAVKATQLAQRGVPIAPNATIKVRFTIPTVATILSIGVIADDTKPSSAAGTYTLAAVKNPAGANVNLLDVQALAGTTYNLDNTLTVGSVANPPLTSTSASLATAANDTIELSFVSNNADLVGAGLRCMVVYREA